MGSGGNMKRLELSLTLLFVALVILDLGTTVYGFSVGAEDSNPLIRLLSGSPLLLFAVKVGQVGVSLILLAYAYVELEPDYPRLYEGFVGMLILYLAYIVSRNVITIWELLK
jgi:hypothetical protein